MGDHRGFVHATKEHLDALRKLGRSAKSVSDAEAAFGAAVDQALAGIPGTTPLALIVPKDKDRQYSDSSASGTITLTVLRKLTKTAETFQRPKWVNDDVPASIIQDQATELYWHQHIRRNGSEPAETMMWTFHNQNQGTPDAAVQEAFKDWSVFPEETVGLITSTSRHGLRGASSPENPSPSSP